MQHSQFTWRVQYTPQEDGTEEGEGGGGGGGGCGAAATMTQRQLLMQYLL
jgi:hypothetical protein